VVDSRRVLRRRTASERGVRQLSWIRSARLVPVFVVSARGSAGAAARFQERTQKRVYDRGSPHLSVGIPIDASRQTRLARIETLAIPETLREQLVRISSQTDSSATVEAPIAATPVATKPRLSADQLSTCPTRARAPSVLTSRSDRCILLSSQDVPARFDVCACSFVRCYAAKSQKHARCIIDMLRTNHYIKESP